MLPCYATLRRVHEHSGTQRESALFDGFYKVEFRTPLGKGAGVIVLREGVLRGGDSAVAYVGQYQVDAGMFSAEIKTFVHTENPNMFNVLGRFNARLNVSGKVGNGPILLNGMSPDAPGVPFDAIVTRLSD